MRTRYRTRDAGRRFLIAVTIVVVAGMGAAVTRLQGDRRGFDALNGRRLRLDSGHVFEIRRVDLNGNIDAVYLNPKSINITKAEAAHNGSRRNVFVELRAPNRPRQKPRVLSA